MPRKFVLAVLLAMSLTASLCAQDPPPPPGVKPEIKGPSIAAVGQEIRFSVVGLTTPPLTGGVNVIQDWASKLRIVADAPDGAEASLDPDVTLGFTEGIRLRLFFVAPKGGTYFLVVNDPSSNVLLMKRVTVGPVVPQPDPPQPPTPPVIGGTRFCMLVREAQEVTPKMNTTEIELTGGKGLEYLRSKNHQMLILSDDRDPPSNLPPSALAAYQKAKGLKMPCLAILDRASWAELYVAPVDPNASVDDIISIIKKYGG